MHKLLLTTLTVGDAIYLAHQYDYDPDWDLWDMDFWMYY